MTSLIQPGGQMPHASSQARCADSVSPADLEEESSWGNIKWLEGRGGGAGGITRGSKEKKVQARRACRLGGSAGGRGMLTSLLEQEMDGSRIYSSMDLPVSYHRPVSFCSSSENSRPR
jgi:hypothetical protein